MTIEIHRENGWIVIRDSEGNRTRYLWDTKREALRRFKREHGHLYKRGIKVIDYTQRVTADRYKGVRW